MTASVTTAASQNTGVGMQCSENNEKPGISLQYTGILANQKHIKPCIECHALQLEYIKQHSHNAYHFYGGGGCTRRQDVELLQELYKKEEKDVERWMGGGKEEPCSGKDNESIQKSYCRKKRKKGKYAKLVLEHLHNTDAALCGFGLSMLCERLLSVNGISSPLMDAFSYSFKSESELWTQTIFQLNVLTVNVFWRQRNRVLLL